MIYSIAAPIGCVFLFISLLFCVACLCTLCHSSTRNVHIITGPSLPSVEVVDVDHQYETNGINGSKDMHKVSTM